MKTNFFSLVTALTLAGFVSLTYAQGNEGPIHMQEMMSQISECRNMHMEEKMCDHQIMDKCLKHTGKSDCQKMMSQAKKEEKKKKK